MEPWTYTWRERIDGVTVVGFVDRDLDGGNPDATREMDVAEFRERMQGLDDVGPGEFVVMDFSHYRMTPGDNGRAVFGLLVMADRQLKARGSVLCVCGHPAQLNPDLQGIFHLDRFIEIYRTRQDALDAIKEREGGEGATTEAN